MEPSTPVTDQEWQKENRKRVSLDYAIALQGASGTFETVMPRAKIIHKYLYGKDPS